jgi:hypothetical protein
MLVIMPFFNNNTVMAQGYNDDSYYSQYPTDDKKYECRTGPFEGFFVSSVEFCKFNKFDDNDRKDIRDNRTGDKGPTGDKGQPGTAGFFQLNSTNVYRHFGVPGGTFGPSFVTCLDGDVVLNSGFEVIQGSGSDLPWSVLFEGQRLDDPTVPPNSYIVFLQSENQNLQ